MSELDLTSSGARAERDALADRTDVIDKVGVLRCLPDDMHCMTPQVAAFYEVSVDVIRQVVQRNRDEFDADGYSVMRPSEVSDMLSLTLSDLGLPNGASSVALFPRRAVLRVGMLLRDSKPARDIRDYLLNAEQSSPARDLTEDEKLFEAFNILRGRVVELERQREANRPAIEYVNTHVIVNDDVMLIEDWGRTYGLTEPQAFALLRDEKNLIYPKVFEHWSRTKGCKVTETEYRPRAGKQSFTWFDVKEQRNAPRRNNGQARKTLYIKAIHSVDLARLVGLLPNIEAAS